jgi:uncharacterized RDD family membrane protein YckC
MKCPKCSYLGFEAVDRCRNCGYDFSLMPAVTVPDLQIRNSADSGSVLDDLSLGDGRAALGGRSREDTGPDLEQVLGTPLSRDVTPASLASLASGASGELPLFGGAMIADDVPLITRPSPPRPPLAVRRATPDVPRVRPESPRGNPLDLALDLEDATTLDPPFSPALRASSERWAGERAEPEESAEDAGVAARFVAVVIDLMILAVVDTIVIYFTMQICGLGLEEIGLLPKGPLLAFLLVQNGGYLVAFTAGGQTLGKMAAGIRVVPASSESTLDLGHALLRTIMWIVLAVPAGLGFLTAVLSRDHRGLHDRFAGTRVVR